MLEITKDSIPDDRMIGRVIWYGGKTKLGKVNKFGFVRAFRKIHSDLVKKTAEVYVNENNLLCTADLLTEGLLVSFNLERHGELVQAVRIKTLITETDSSPLIEALNEHEVTTDEKLTICGQFSAENYQPALPAISDLMHRLSLRYDRQVWNDPVSYQDEGFGFVTPESIWLDKSHDLYATLPAYIKLKLLIEGTQVQQSVAKLAALPTTPSIKWQATYSLLTASDVKLAQTWLNKSISNCSMGGMRHYVDTDSPQQMLQAKDFEVAQMLSARYAERVVAEFFRSLGSSVDDIALHQTTGESQAWQNYDLLVDGKIPIDVKNARKTASGSPFVQYTVKKFKNDSTAGEVSVFGVLSPYLTLNKMTNGEDLGDWEDISILGQTSNSTIRKLEQDFSKRKLLVQFGAADRWPVWAFDNRVEWFTDSQKAREVIKEFIGQLTEELTPLLDENLIPIFIGCGEEVPKDLRKNLHPWQHWFLEKLEKSSNHLSLPWLYLFTFQHFIDAVTNMKEAESKGYDPVGYRSLLFFSNYMCRPLGIVDPVGALYQLTKTLSILWENRHDAQLANLSNFVLKGEGLLRATDYQGNKVTVVAYCGGILEKRGKCGNFPLIRGKHGNCADCGMLICDKCEHCSDACKAKRGDDGTAG